MLHADNSDGNLCSKCKSSDDDIMIHCFACNAFFHIHCIGLPAEMAHKMGTDTGFHYYCESHRNLSISSLLLKMTKMQSLNMDLKQLMENYESVINVNFDDLYANLETAKENNFVSTGDDVSSLELLPSPLLQPQSSKKPIKKKTNSLLKSTLTPNRRNTTNVTVNRGTSGTRNKRTPGTSVKNATINDVNSASQLVQTPLEIPSTVPVETEDVGPGIEAPQTSVSVPLLNCVAPSRSIFLSGLNVETSVDDITNYINYHASNELNIPIRKMQFKSVRPYSSFVLNIGRNEKLFTDLCNVKFWPCNAIVREYQFFQNRQPNVNNYRTLAQSKPNPPLLN